MKKFVIFVIAVLGLFIALPVVVHLLVGIRGGLSGIAVCLLVIALINFIRH